MNIYFIICFFIVALSFLCCYKIGAFSIVKLNYYSIIFYLTMFMCVVGAFIISSGIVDDTFFVSPIAKLSSVKVEALYITCISFSLFFIAVFFTERVLSLFFYKEKNNFCDWPEFISKKAQGVSNYSLIILVVLVAVCSCYYIYSISPTPLFLAIKGSSATEIAQVRLDVTKYYSGIGYVKTLAQSLSMILSFLFLINVVNFKKNYIAFILSAILSVVILFSDGEKAPLVLLLIGYILCFSYSGLLNLKVITVVGFVIAAFICSSYLLLFNISSISGLMSMILERIFIAQEIAVFYAVDYFHKHDFLGFSSMCNVMMRMIIPHHNLTASELFMQYYQPEMLSNGGWNINGFFAHESYADFGWFGVVFGAIYGGVFNGIVCFYFRLVEKNILNLSFFIYYSISFITILTSFNQMFMNTRLILIFIIYLLLNSINNFFVRKKCL